ncbi:MAG TPA: L,D-transpeptidase family protein [Acidimicrobiales bacterium]|nr:L,D-transpeptidase family protein [Acidimicrobiales bacterium]
MKRTRILRMLCTGAAALVVVTGGVSVTLGLSHRPTTVEVAGVGSGVDLPTTSSSSTSTTKPPAVTSTTSTTAPPSEPAAPVGTLRRGDRGPEVLDLQRRLRGLGYWLGSLNDSFGPLTEQAVTAFQKVEGMTADGVAGPATQAALSAAERPSTAAAGDLLEVDKERQVLFVVRGGTVAWVLNVSTGTELPYRIDGRTELADTPVGRWKVAWAVDGVDVGELGALYRPRYFHADGIAVHGHHSVPAVPASHGCVRVTEAAMDWLWAENLMPMGSVVWVH